MLRLPLLQFPLLSFHTSLRSSPHHQISHTLILSHIRAQTQRKIIATTSHRHRLLLQRQHGERVHSSILVAQAQFSMGVVTP